MKVELLIFDFDGTLFDTSLDIANVINYTLEKFGRKPLNPETIWSFTGCGFRKTLEKAFNTTSDSVIEEAYWIAMKYYEEHSGEYSKPIDNVLEFLRRDTHKKAILSNKNIVPMEKVLDRFKIKELFEKIYGFESFEYIKPDPKTVEQVLKELKVKKENAIIIGDADQDVLLAKNASMRCFIIPSKLITIDYPCTIFKDYDELELILKKL